MSDALAEFERLLAEKGKGFVKAQIVWVTVKDIDWDKKTMTATSISDGLDYFKVQLGLGNFYRKPKKDTKAVIALVNKTDAGLLIDADEIEEEIIKLGDTEFTIKEKGYAIKQGSESLKDVLNDFIDEVNKIIVVQGTTINVAAVTAIKQRLNTILIE